MGFRYCGSRRLLQLLAGEDLFRALAGDALVDCGVCGAFAAEEDDLAVWGETELLVEFRVGSGMQERSHAAGGGFSAYDWRVAVAVSEGAHGFFNPGVRDGEEVAGEPVQDAPGCG